MDVGHGSLWWWVETINHGNMILRPFAVEWLCRVLELLQVHTNQRNCFMQTNKRGVIVLSLYWKQNGSDSVIANVLHNRRNQRADLVTFKWAGEHVWERASIMVFVHRFTTDWTLSWKILYLIFQVYIVITSIRQVINHIFNLPVELWQNGILGE